jgi:hypothetical protein
MKRWTVVLNRGRATVPLSGGIPRIVGHLIETPDDKDIATVKALAATHFGVEASTVLVSPAPEFLKATPEATLGELA